MSGEAAVASPAPVVARAPADVLRLAVAVTTLVVLLVVERLFGAAVVGFAHDLLRGLDAFGETFLTAAVAVVRAASVGLLVAGLVAAVFSGRWRTLLTVVAAVVMGAAIFGLVNLWTDAVRPPLTELSDVAGPLTSTWFPTSAGIVAASAVVTSAGPWLPRRPRRIGWVLAFALAATRFVAAPVSGAALLAVVCGWVGGSAAVVMLGAPSRRPGRESVMAGLRDVGVELATIEPASVDARGSTPYFGTTPAGESVFVKVLGSDERSADLLFRMYRRLMPRDLGDERPFSSLRRAVEHEALVSLAVTRVGVRTPAVVGFARAEPGGFTLCYEGIAGKSLDRVDTADLTDGVLAQVWEQIAILRRHGVAHRDLRLANLFLDRDGRIWLIDFGFAELAASGLLLSTDMAELLAALSLKVGAERAVRAGAAAVGADALATALPRLDPKYLSGATRTALAKEPALLDAIRQAATVEAPPAGRRAA